MKFTIANINIITKDLGVSNDDFWVNAEVDISEIGGYGAETFSVNFVGISRIKRITENENLMGRGLIIGKEYHEAALRRIIENLLERINTDNWEGFCVAFEKYFDHL